MSDWPLYDGARIQAVGVDTTTSRGIIVTASASTNIKGGWSSLISATSLDACYLGITTTLSNAAASQILIDIGAGPSGSERIIIPDLHVSISGINRPYFYSGLFPIFIPAGT